MVLRQLFRTLSVVGCYVSHIQGSRKIDIFMLRFSLLWYGIGWFCFAWFSSFLDDRLSKDRRVVHRVTTSDNEWQRIKTSGTTSDNKWQRVTTNDKEWQRQTTSGKTNEKDKVHFKEWMIAILSVTKADTLATSRNLWV